MKVMGGVCIFNCHFSHVLHCVSLCGLKGPSSVEIWTSSSMIQTTFHSQALFRAESDQNGMKNLYMATCITHITLNSANTGWRSESLSLPSIFLSEALPICLQIRASYCQVIFVKSFNNYIKKIHQVYRTLPERSLLTISPEKPW